MIVRAKDGYPTCKRCDEKNTECTWRKKVIDDRQNGIRNKMKSCESCTRSKSSCFIPTNTSSQPPASKRHREDDDNDNGPGPSKKPKRVEYVRDEEEQEQEQEKEEEEQQEEQEQEEEEEEEEEPTAKVSKLEKLVHMLLKAVANQEEEKKRRRSQEIQFQKDLLESISRLTSKVSQVGEETVQTRNLLLAEMSLLRDTLLSKPHNQ